MTPLPFRPLKMLIVTACAALLAACQSVPPPSAFSPAQVAVLQSEGFLETVEDNWELTMSERLLFAVNESVIQPEQEERIARLGRNLVSVGILTARVEGHTDSTGADDYNLKLSHDRAKSAAAPLQASGMRFTAEQIIGHGKALPLSSNDTPEGRQDNRRVVVIVTPQ